MSAAVHSFIMDGCKESRLFSPLSSPLIDGSPAAVVAATAFLKLNSALYTPESLPWYGLGSFLAQELTSTSLEK